MKTIQTILEEFDVFDSGYIQSRHNMRSFLRKAFDEYKKGLREAVEGMKSQKCFDGYEGDPAVEREIGRNIGLDSVLELVK